MTENKETKEKRGLCGKCPVGIGMPVCAVCALVAIVVFYNIVT